MIGAKKDGPANRNYEAEKPNNWNRNEKEILKKRLYRIYKKTNNALNLSKPGVAGIYLCVSVLDEMKRHKSKINGRWSEFYANVRWVASAEKLEGLKQIFWRIYNAGTYNYVIKRGLKDVSGSF